MQLLRSICSQLLFVLVAAFPLAAAAQPPTMKAIVVHQSGGPEVLKYEDASRPQPKDDDILIRVITAGVNPVDVFIREGRTTRFPFIPGMDVAGVVEQAGNKVTAVMLSLRSQTKIMRRSSPGRSILKRPRPSHSRQRLRGRP